MWIELFLLFNSICLLASVSLVRIFPNSFEGLIEPKRISEFDSEDYVILILFTLGLFILATIYFITCFCLVFISKPTAYSFRVISLETYPSVFVLAQGQEAQVKSLLNKLDRLPFTLEEVENGTTYNFFLALEHYNYKPSYAKFDWGEFK